MEAPLLKRRLNPFLLISTVVVLSLLAGLSVLYQSELNDLVSERKNLSATLEDRNQRISQLENRVDNLTDRRSELNQSLVNLQTSLAQRQNQLEERNSTIQSLQNTLQNKNETVANLSATVDEQNRTISNLSEKNANLTLDLKEICTSNDNNLTENSRDICNEYNF